MRRPLLLLFLLHAVLHSQAQDVLDKVAKDSCPCVDEAMQDSTDAAAAKLGTCMLTKAMPYKKELKKKYGMDLDRIDGESGRAFGQMLGIHIAMQCPRFAEFSMRLAAQTEKENAEIPPPPTTIRTITGVVQETHPSAFLTVLVRAGDGTAYELLLLDHVANAERVYQDPAKARGLAADWTYEEREFLDPYSRSYKTYRVIRGITPRE
ncbi:MAG: hypothetical protein QM724_03585 [Flavobacteriales bacterium]